jgi:hypothetical protein
VGHGIAATVGVIVAKLFIFNHDFNNIRWIAGPLSCGIASFVMAVTNTVHPPGGATALLAAIDPTVLAMGWMFIPLLLLGSILMLVIALLINNIQRQFPVFWWTPRDVGIQKRPDIESSGMDGKERENEGSLRSVGHSGFKQIIVINSERILVPDGFPLDAEQIEVLEILRIRLRDWSVDDEQDQHFTFSGSDTTHVEGLTSPD